MFKVFKSVFILLLLGVFAQLSSAQTASTGTEAAAVKDDAPAVKSAPAPGGEAGGYKQAAWGMSKEEVSAALHIDLAHSEQHYTVTDLPWEIMRMAAVSESDPDDLLGQNLEWFYGERQDMVLCFYKNRFFAYTSSLDKVLSAAEYKQKITSLHGASTRSLSFQNTDPEENRVTGSYGIEIWDGKKTIIALGTEKLFPGQDQEAESNYDITYLGADVFGEFKKDAAKVLAQKKEEERKQSEKVLQEQKNSALEVIQ